MHRLVWQGGQHLAHVAAVEREVLILNVRLHSAVNA